MALAALFSPGLTDGSFGGGGASRASAPSTRLLYSSDWTGRSEIFALDPSRRRSLGQVTSGGPTCASGVLACGFAYPLPAPDGTRIAYLTVAPAGGASALWIARADGRAPRKVAEGLSVLTDQVAAEVVGWSPDSRRLAYLLVGKVHVVQADGSRERTVAVPPSWFHGAGASPDGRWRATPEYRFPGSTIVALTVTNGKTTFRLDATTTAAWSPDSRLLAFGARDGIRVADVSTGRARRLTADRGFSLTWSPDSRSLAYVHGSADRLGRVTSGDLRTVTLGGRVTTLVAADRAYGGRMISLAWTRPPASIRYRTPERAPATRVSRDGVLADWPIERIAADGDRVAYVACGRVFVWSRDSGRLLQAPPGSNAGPWRCSSAGDYVAFWIYSLALSGDRVVWAERAGNAGQTIWLGGAVLARERRRFTLGRENGAMGGAWSNALGHAAGSGPLLVFGSWHETSVSDPVFRIVTTEQTILRVGLDGCPCIDLATSPGPLVPADVDGGRVVAYGDNETLVLDGDGARRLSIPASPLAAQLAGSDLVLILRGELRHYDAAGGKLLHVWPLPDVPSGAPCGGAPRCTSLPRLTLQDAARGLVAYVLDGNVHLLRLADGADRAVAPGATAAFMDAGLVYANGTRLRLVPFDRLPLR